MGRLTFYRRNPEEFIDGVVGMTLEEVGAYTLLLDLMYARGGAIPDSPRTLCAILNVDSRVWKRLRQSLILKGKIVDTGDGFLTNRRVEKELTYIHDTRQARVKAGSTGGKLSAMKRANSLKNNDDEQASAQALAQAKSNQNKKKSTSSYGSKEPPELFTTEEAKASSSVVVADAPTVAKVVHLREPIPAQQAVDAYNRTAEACGWALCAKLNDERRRKIATRLRDDGGMDGWCSRLERASRPNSFAMDEQRNKGWKANIDWFISDKATLKIIEGQYETNIDSKQRPVTQEDWDKRYVYFDTKGEWREDRGWGPAPNHPEHMGPRKQAKVSQ